MQFPLTELEPKFSSAKRSLKPEKSTPLHGGKRSKQSIYSINFAPNNSAWKYQDSKTRALRCSQDLILKTDTRCGGKITDIPFEGARPKSSFTVSCTFGIRTIPPTRMTSPMSDLVYPASLRHFRHGSRVRSLYPFVHVPPII